MNINVIGRRFVVAVLAASSLLLVSSSRAALFNAKPAGGSWSDANTWVEGGPPGAGDDAVVNNNVHLNGPQSINNITDGGAGTFNIDSALNVGGSFTVLGTAHVQQSAAVVIAGGLNVGIGTQYDPSCFPITVGGNTTIDGVLRDGCGGNQVDALNGDVTVDAGGQWQLTDVTEWQVGGNLFNNGTVTESGGGITFTGSGKVISGNATPIPNLVVNGSVANNTTLTVKTSLSGSGQLTQGSGTSLIVNGAVTIASLDANTNPNTVTYSGGNQTILGTTYQQLLLGGTATKTFASDTTSASSLEIPSPLRANVNANLTVALGVTVDSGATLGGTGTLNSSVTVNGTLSPGLTTGTQLGTLSFNSAPTLNNASALDINRANAPDADLVSVSGTLSFGGTLTVVNRGAAPVAGDTFQLFSASFYSGSFSTVTLPTLGANLGWTNTLAQNGSIAVISTAAPVGPKLSITQGSGLITIAWDGTTFPGYRLQVESNFTSGWSDVSGGDVNPFQFSSGAFNPPPNFFRLINP